MEELTKRGYDLKNCRFTADWRWNVEYKIMEVAQRIRGLRELLEISVEEMAKVTDLNVEEYQKHELGEVDFSFTFIYKCAGRFDVDIIEILKGTSPTLSFYSIIRKGDGLPITRREGFQYKHLAPFFKDKLAEPFRVLAKYSEAEQNKEIKLSYHEGQEIDIILKGTLKIRLEDHTEILNEGDAIYYNSGHGHGMIAVGGEDCEFLAIILKNNR